MSINTLKPLLASPVAYHRIFAKVAGGVASGVFLSQCWYWTTHNEANRDGWFYKNRNDWEDETGLTRREQDTARNILRKQGVLEERQGCMGGKRCVWLRLNTDRLAEIMMGLEQNPTVQNVPLQRYENATCDTNGAKTPLANVQNVPLQKPETSRSNGTKRAVHIGTENTAEITAKTTNIISDAASGTAVLTEDSNTLNDGLLFAAASVVINKTTAPEIPAKNTPAEKPVKAVKPAHVPCPADFAPSEASRAWAEREFPDVDLEALTDDFIDYWVNGNGHTTKRADWQQTWKVRVRAVAGSGRFRKTTPRPGAAPGASPRPLNRVEQRVAEGEAAINAEYEARRARIEELRRQQAAQKTAQQFMALPAFDGGYQ